MEDRGADPYSVSEASIKALQESDIYVGVFGREYSDTTFLEYQEAIKNKKPCFAYIKRVRYRDDRLSAFLKNNLKPNFKYYEFGNNTNDLIRQLEVDLQNFIVSTLRLGIQARAEKLGKTIDLISKEEKNALNYISAKDPLAEAQELFKQEKYLESLFMTVAIVQATLRYALKNHGVITNSSNTLGEMITQTQNFELFDKDIVNILRNISIYRNQVVHLGTSPDKKQMQEFLESARLLIKKLSTSRIEATKGAECWDPLPVIKFNLMGYNLKRKLPQVGWELTNHSPYQLKIRIEIHPWLGKKDLNSLIMDDDINGRKTYSAEPNSVVWTNGTFTLPGECGTSTEELVLEIRSFATDVNCIQKGEHKMLSSTWKYVRQEDYWFYYPQGP